MFRRGAGPLVSVLLPSRGRPKWLLEAVDSLYSLAENKSLVEFIFKADADDTATVEAATRLVQLLPGRALVSPQGKGYLDLHVFINDLSAVARGDWLFIFNDDARMQTSGWDQILLKANPWRVPRWGGSQDVCLLAPGVAEREISWEFPILRRRTFELLGHFSLSYANDAYIYKVMSLLNAALLVPDIQVSHFINDVDDLTKREGKLTADKQMTSVNSQEFVAMQDRDREVLKRAMGVKS